MIEQVLFLVLVTLMWWKCALVIRGVSEAVCSLQCPLRWEVLICRRGSADLAADPDLQEQLVSALFEAPSGDTSCGRSHRDATSTLTKTEFSFYLWSKTVRKWKVVTAFQSGPHWHCDWIHPLFEVEQLDSRAQQSSQTWHGPGIKPPAELQREKWHRWANFCSSRARLIFILSPLEVKEWNKEVNCAVTEGQTDLLFHPGFLSGTLNRDSSHSVAWISHWDCLPCGLTEPQWQQDANKPD